MNINQTLLISEEILKKDGYADDNLDMNYITPAIQVSQDMGLQPVIGTNLYRKLQSLVDDGSIDDVANVKYKTLLDTYIVPFLAFKTMSEIVIPISFKNKNQGVVTTSDDKSYQTDIKNVQYLKGYYDDRATFYLLRLSDFLVTFSRDFPEYETRNDKSEMESNPNAYNSGIYLGITNKNKRC